MDETMEWGFSIPRLYLSLIKFTDVIFRLGIVISDLRFLNVNS